MLSVTEAQALVLAQCQALPEKALALAPALLGLVLAEDVASDLDMPPFDKALMDGYAVEASDLAGGEAILTVIEEVMAGQTPQQRVTSGQAVRIMTGAPIPNGADAVVMIERSKRLEGERVALQDAVKPGQNILPRGREMRQGETVLRAGVRLRPQELGILAGVGRSRVKVYPAPIVAVLPTGDEIVEVDQIPGPGQIRNSNGHMLLGQVARAGGVPRFLGIARDQPEHLRSLAAEGLQADILVLSGGVSAGQRDLVPAILAELGVQPVFHKVEMKPGKPVFFGTATNRAGSARPALVFGLPGNPVSTLVCFELFVRPAIGRLMGLSDPGPATVQAVLEEEFVYKSDRPTYYPAQLGTSAGKWQVRPVPWFGSADLCGLLPANAFMLVPRGDQRFVRGQLVSVLKVE
jgi:molybdopterin molybdotransferase